MTSHHPTDDRETLSALFDGQLQGDAARFALKRVGHDAQWRQACGRWQLYGDVLRGQAQAVADCGFADRVAAAIAQESQAQAAAEPLRASGARRGWIGGALAASVAVAALFVTKPFSDEPAPSRVDTAPRVASASAPSTPAAVARTTVSPARPAPRTPDPSLGLSAAAVAAVEVPRRVADRRASRGQSQRAGQRARQAPAVASSRTATAVASAAAADAILPSTTLPAKPFQPQHVEATARPWPRAVLPQYSGGSAMTAAFGASAAAGSPSFYPFEPQPVAEPDAATTSGDESPRR